MMRLRGFPPDGVPALSYVGTPSGSIIGTPVLPVGNILSVPGQTGPQGPAGPAGPAGVDGRHVTDISITGNDLVFTLSDETTDEVTVPALAAAQTYATSAANSATNASSSASAAASSASDASSSATNAANSASAAANSATSAATAAAGMQPESEKGQPGGYAPLDAAALVPAAYLPSYVDDVVEYASSSGFPATGTAGKIYVAIDTGKIYRWSGSTYVEISPSPGSTDAVPEGASNKYYTDARVQTKVQAMFGTAAGTVAQGNDARLSDTRTPTDGSVTNAKVATGAGIALSKLAAGYVQGSANGTPATLTVWVGSEAQYTAIGTKDANTLYFRTA